MIASIVLSTVMLLREVPARADAFVDSIGINTHFHFGGPWSADFPQLEHALLSLGVRHIRDGLIDTTWYPYYARLNALGRAGIHSTLTVADMRQTPALLRAYPRRVADSMEAYEAPNEYDASGDPHWVSAIRSFQRLLYEAVKGDPRTARFPVIGPSFASVNDEALVGDLSSYMDFANMHNYFAGHNPGTPGWGGAGFGSHYGSIEYNARAAAQVGGDKPLISTETGYCTQAGAQGSVTPAVMGRYVPRLFLLQFAAGIVRTFEYELIDDYPQRYFGNCGLLDDALRPKPAFYALKALIAALRDPGERFTAQPLAYSLDANIASLRHQLFQKRNGTYVLSLWNEVPGWDPDAPGGGTPIAVAAAPVTMSLPFTPSLLRVASFDDAGQLRPVERVPLGARITIPIDDHVTLVTFRR